MITKHSDLFVALHKSGNHIEISKKIYYHFLKVLPPVDIGLDWFVFQEGDGDQLHFTKADKQYYCYAKRLQLFTEDEDIFYTLKRAKKGFLVLDIRDSDGIELSGYESDYLYCNVPSASALAEFLGVTFRF